MAGQPRGRGKVERYMGTASQMCLPALPGYAPRGTRDRAAQARLTLAELDAALGEFIVKVCNHRVHGKTGKPPQARWETGGFLPHLPESAEQLDLLLLTVAKPRKVHSLARSVSLAQQVRAGGAGDLLEHGAGELLDL